MSEDQSNQLGGILKVLVPLLLPTIEALLSQLYQWVMSEVERLKNAHQSTGDAATQTLSEPASQPEQFPRLLK